MVQQEPLAKVKVWLDQLLHDAVLSLTYSVEVQPLAHGAGPTQLVVCFEGPDVPLLLFRNAELLLALEHLATQVLHLESHEHDSISFDAAGFKSNRARQLQRSARQAVFTVHTSGRAFHFLPMSSRERRLLHLALAHYGLPSASEGDPPRRHLVLHPAPKQ